MQPPAHRIYLYLFAYCGLITSISGCKDFSRFDCFRLESGCAPVAYPSDDLNLPIDLSIADSDRDQDINLSRRGQQNTSSLNDLGLNDFALLDMETDLSHEQLDMTIEQVDATSAPDPLLSCREDVRLNLRHPNISNAFIHWHCFIENQSGQVSQVMTAEMTTFQASHAWRYLLGQCNSDQPTPLAVKLCKDFDQFRTHNYRNELRSEWRQRFNMSPSNDQLDKSVRHSAITELSPSEILSFIDSLNLWAEEVSHPYRYALPTFAVWQTLLQGTNQNQYVCGPQIITGVYQGTNEFGNNRGDGCNFDRPRTVLVTPQNTLCYDQLWTQATMGEEITEDRSLNSDLPLCDIYGNVREILQACTNTEFCTVGGGWKSVQTGATVSALDSDSTDDETGFRLIRFKVP